MSDRPDLVAVPAAGGSGWWRGPPRVGGGRSPRSRCAVVHAGAARSTAAAGPSSAADQAGHDRAGADRRRGAPAVHPARGWRPTPPASGCATSSAGTTCPGGGAGGPVRPRRLVGHPGAARRRACRGAWRCRRPTRSTRWTAVRALAGPARGSPARTGVMVEIWYDLPASTAPLCVPRCAGGVMKRSARSHPCRLRRPGPVHRFRRVRRASRMDVLTGRAGPGMRRGLLLSGSVPTEPQESTDDSNDSRRPHQRRTTRQRADPGT